MLTNQTKSQLLDLRLLGMAQEYEHQLASPTLQDLNFDERLARLAEAEIGQRVARRTKRLHKNAKLREPADPADIDFRATRGLDKGLMGTLLCCDWIKRGQHVFLTGPTGVGKSWLACALGTQATRLGMSVLYKRTPRLIEELRVAHDDGSIPEVRSDIAKVKLLILDDWGLEALGAQGRNDLLEIVEDRVNRTSMIITSQLPVDKWHHFIGDDTIADAILDRIVYNAHRISLKGDSLRKSRGLNSSKE